MNRKKITKPNKNAWYLIEQLAWTDFKLRYNSSVFGYLWSLMVPIMIFGVLYLVFSVFIKFNQVEHYPIFLMLGIVLWTFFAESTLTGMQSIQRKAQLITCMNFPKWYIVLASNLTCMLTLFLNLMIFFIFVAFSSIRLSIESLWMPVFVFELVIFCFFLSLFLSSFYLRFRDLSHIWGIALQIGFWFTPIVYPSDIVPAGFRILITINPLARIVDDCRSVLIYHQVPGVPQQLVTLVMILGIAFLGTGVFYKRSKFFAEEV